jgi:hypothetical protein
VAFLGVRDVASFSPACSAFYLGRERMRVSYFIVSGRRIVLPTLFRKTRQREEEEIDRAEPAMRRSDAEGHTAEEDW